MLALRGRALAPLPTTFALATRSLSSACEIRPPAKRRRCAAPLASRRHASSTPGPSARYDELVRDGTLRDDDFQRSVVSMLQKLHDDIEAYEPPDIPEPKMESRSFFSRFQTPTPTIPTIPDNVPKGAWSWSVGANPAGLYLFGDVGCGKTMLMDILYETLQAPSVVKSKRRVHFHAFMCADDLATRLTRQDRCAQARRVPH